MIRIFIRHFVEIYHLSASEELLQTIVGVLLGDGYHVRRASFLAGNVAHCVAAARGNSHYIREIDLVLHKAIKHSRGKNSPYCSAL